jgi:hypothetical protein
VTDSEHNAALLNLRLNFADIKSTDELFAVIEASSGRQALRASA